MNLHEDAIIFEDVCKTYQLYQNKWQMVRDALGFKNKKPSQEFYALKNISLTIKRGERIGLIGRNGAGKSTLLKLITGNFAQTSGKIIVNGNIQALMNTGVGFHPEFTGLENIKSSLLYNGLSQKQLKEAIEDIIDFVELGEFLEQPLKTYSLGMQARLYFAVATAIQPEILIVDEVLGAGDSYFSAKSAERMKKLTNSGCTLLLVSHATSQVLQFCDKAIWIECGEKVKEGSSLEVVKLYEEFTKKLEVEAKNKAVEQLPSTSIIQSKWLREKIMHEVLSLDAEAKETEKNATPTDGGISRWQPTAEGLKILSVSLLDKSKQISYCFQQGETLIFQIEFEALLKGFYDCHFVIVVFNSGGQVISRHRSNLYQYNLDKSEKNKISMIYEKVLFGTGEFVFSAAIFQNFDNNRGAKYYDLLSRSFEFKIVGQNDDPSLFLHPAKWEEELPCFKGHVEQNENLDLSCEEL